MTRGEKTQACGPLPDGYTGADGRNREEVAASRGGTGLASFRGDARGGYTMRFRCYRCSNPPRYFEFADKDACPKCGTSVDATPAVVELADVHLTVMDARGPIMGSRGRQFIACDPKR